MEIIGLFGKANCGKTNTLNRVIDELLTLGAKVISSNPPNTSRDLAIQDRNVCMEFRGKKVCVATGGDEGAALKDNCEFFANNKADIVISATRTKGGTCKELVDFATSVNGKNNVFWVEKLRPYHPNFHLDGENINDGNKAKVYDDMNYEIHSSLNEMDKMMILRRLFILI
ncbi:MAG: hypothetical protein Q4B94_09205 [Pseudomonadota bacterium]|nr:hypothetical protein [Pseudomonadota bacterium]